MRSFRWETKPFLVVGGRRFRRIFEDYRFSGGEPCVYRTVSSQTALPIVIIVRSSPPRSRLVPDHFSPRARHARVVQHSSSRPEVRLLRSRARRAPRAAPRSCLGAPRFPSEKPCRMRGSHAASSLVARGGADRTGETRAIGVAARAALFPNHHRASDAPPVSPSRSQTRARGG